VMGDREIHDGGAASAPVIFIHYGSDRRLRWVLDCAARANPGKRIIFLGDESNRKFAGGAEFFSFERFSKGGKARKFGEIFQVVQGTRHVFTKPGGSDHWLRFVFLRWFLIEEFLNAEGIDAFWTFDSDTLLLAPIEVREKRFFDVEASTQCRGQCLNGWVGSRSLVGRYTACIIDLFSDPAYLDFQRDRLRIQSGLAFTEMDAFAEFRLREGVRTRRASDIVDGEAFDDALAFFEDYETAERRILGRNEVKRLWTSPQGGVFARHRASGEMVRLLTCNMSWMPDFLFRRLLRLGRPGVEIAKEEKRFVEISIEEPPVDKFWRTFRGEIRRVRTALTAEARRTRRGNL